MNELTAGLLHWIEHYRYAGVLGLQFAGILGFPIPDDTTLVFYGYLIHRGYLALAPTLACAFAGSALGVTLGFVVGHFFGLYLLERFGPRLGVTAERLERVHAWFRRVGKWGLLAGYFVPGIRHLNGLLAGSAKLEFPVFALFAYAGGALWTAAFILAGVLLGEGWSRLPAGERKVLLVRAAVAVVAALGIALVRRGRRRPAGTA